MARQRAARRTVLAVVVGGFMLGWRNWWLEAAMWDLAGKLAGKPVYKLLQEHEQTVSRVRLYASLGSLRPLEERRRYLDEIRGMGFDAVKIRVKYATLEEDLGVVRGVRAAVGDDFTVGVDANQGWPVSLFRPNPDWDLERGMAELRRRVKTPIAGGELHGGWHELQPLFEHDSFEKYQPDAMFCGLTVSKRVMQECRRRSPTPAARSTCRRPRPRRAGRRGAAASLRQALLRFDAGARRAAHDPREGTN